NDKIMTELEQKIHDIIADTMQTLGFGVVRIRMNGGGESAGARKTLEILIERLDAKPVSIGDCRMANINISALLDVEDVIATRYNLEVSSAGVERPLVKLADFDRFKDNVVLVKLHKAVMELKKYQGKLLGIDGEKVLLELPKSKSQDAVIMQFEFDNIKDAKLVLTDELFRKIVK
ncbi:MAG: ribosome maturation factor RimP, partial [Proteobacteria bacterium]|nr:ribosome maturation factor RimP [Pseudomonadota bacterium]